MYDAHYEVYSKLKGKPWIGDLAKATYNYCYMLDAGYNKKIALRLSAKKYEVKQCDIVEVVEANDIKLHMARGEAAKKDFGRANCGSILARERIEREEIK